MIASSPDGSGLNGLNQAAAEIMASAASMRASAPSCPARNTVCSIEGETWVPVIATRMPHAKSEYQIDRYR
jgi:hypothetical protein